MNCRHCLKWVSDAGVIITVPTGFRMENNIENPSINLSIETTENLTLHFHHECFIFVAGKEFDPYGA